MVTLAGIEQSFARAEQMLEELCGWRVDDEVIRRATHAEAKRAQQGKPDDAAAWASVPDPLEVQIDAGKVNTLEGWRDVKVGVFLRRNAGSTATPDQWDTRSLPKPAMRTTIAAIETSDAFGERVRREADRLGVTTAADVSVLGDGAEWIWNLAGDHLPQAEGVLDIYHAVEHISAAVTSVWGETDAPPRIAAARQALLTDGKPGLECWLAQAFRDLPDGVATDPLLSVAAYFAKHPTRLEYAERLAEGRSIGSGAVEGAIKQNVNLRLKRTGARWRVDHVGPLVELRALSRTPDWAALWNQAA